MEGKEDGDAKLTSWDYSKPEQRWVHTSGNNLINMATGLSLLTKVPVWSRGGVWSFGEGGTINELYSGGNLMASKLLENKEEYGIAIGFAKPNELSYQFEKIMFKDLDNMPKFKIKSELDDRVLEVVDGIIKMNSLKDSDDNQLWCLVETEKGFLFVNEGSRHVLSRGGITHWEYNEETKFIEDAEGSGNILRRGGKQIDGTAVGWTNLDNPNVNQAPERCMFEIQPVH